MAKKVTIGWNNPTPNTDLDHLEIWRKTEVGGTYAQIGIDILDITAGASLDYEDTNEGLGLTETVTYYYEVRAYNDIGGEVEGTDYSKIESSILISETVGSEIDLTIQLVNRPDIDVDGTIYTVSHGGSWASLGLADDVMTTDGYLVADMGSITDIESNFLIKLRDTNENTEYIDPEGICIFVVNSKYYTLVAGDTGVDSGIPIALNDRVRLIRSGANIKAEYYRGAVWSLIKDFGDVTTIASGTLYCQIAGNQIGSKIYNPKIFR